MRLGAGFVSAEPQSGPGEPYASDREAATDALSGRLAARDISVAEDAARAFGSPHRHGRRVGVIGQPTCLSFSRSRTSPQSRTAWSWPAAAAKPNGLRIMQTLGIRASQLTRTRSTGYRVDGFGLPYRLSAEHAAVGRVQPARFDHVVDRRMALGRGYARALADLEVRVVDVDIDDTVPFNLVVRVRDQVFTRMKAAGIGVGVRYPPNHPQSPSSAGTGACSPPNTQHRSCCPAVSPCHDRHRRPYGGRRTLPLRYLTDAPAAAMRTSPAQSLPASGRPRSRTALPSRARESQLFSNSEIAAPTLSPVAVPDTVIAVPASASGRVCSSPAEEGTGVSTAGLPNAVSSAIVPAPARHTTTSASASVFVIPAPSMKLVTK